MPGFEVQGPDLPATCPDLLQVRLQPDLHSRSILLLVSAHWSYPTSVNPVLQSPPDADLSTELGLNVYDVRKTCDRQKDGPLCYKGLQWIDSWMNEAAVKKELGVNPSLTFQSCNMQVNRDFTLQADGMRNSALLLTDLVNEGVRLLVYAGNAGMRLVGIPVVGVR